MIVKTVDYDDAVGAASIAVGNLVAETTALSYNIFHEFGKPAQAVVILADVDGSILRKYDVDAANDSIYIGPGRIMIQEPAPDPDDEVSNIVFDGRIIKATGDISTNRVTLIAEDWMSQLGDERITYDMREIIAGATLRESTIYPDLTDDVYVGVSKGYTYAKSDNGGVITDESTEANESTADDMTLLPSPLTVDDAYYFGFDVPCTGFKLNVTTAGDWTGSIEWQYYDGDSWEEVTNGPTGDDSRFETAGEVDYSWDLPTDWATVAVDGTTKYWIRAIITGVAIDNVRPLGGQVWTTYSYLNDGNVTITNDVHNNMYLIFPNNMAGSIKSKTGPYTTAIDAAVDSELVDGGAKAAPNYGATIYRWNDTNTTMSHSFLEGDAGTHNIDYYFKIPLGISDHLTEITKATLHLIYTWADNEVTGSGSLELKYYNTTGAAYVTMTKVSNDIGDYNKSVRSFTLPDTALGTAANQDIIDSDGILKIRFVMINAHNDNTVNLKIYYAMMEIEADTTALSTVYEIEDCGSQRITITEDISETGEALWVDTPYCVGDLIKNHINGLVTARDPLVTLTTNVEATTGISTMHFEERTTDEILNELQEADQTVRWLPLSTKVVQWKKTFNDGAPTALTDASVTRWGSEWDWKTVVNEYHIYGARIGDSQLSLNTSDLDTDPGATSKVTYGVTRSEIARNQGLTAAADAEAVGEYLVTRDDDALMLLMGEFPGLSTLRLGDEVSITSTLLGLTAANYVVVNWAYDSVSYRTNMLLHPRGSVGYVKQRNVGSFIRDASRVAIETANRAYVPVPAGKDF